MSSPRYKLIFFTPPPNLETIKTAIFATGAGRYPGKGDYSEVCFTTAGASQFRPGHSSNPTIGQPGRLEEVAEVRCEILCCGEQVVRDAVEALKLTHPYETVAYDVVKLEPF
ncbi:GTP cyclohydrolase 1 type 2/Nif3 [Acrodontium crateriforme]|uniref:ATP phosphoribosyltransferase n=1 Tax=Acrodontium crateriforme TaxID=150365 RepID=A0AAQ3MBD0_9PEZI|nr:GTP cyclohydrolase 1 type 2/Nif3 [Acrodontium crateriforme]